MAGTVSRTARVSIARWNPKEAANERGPWWNAGASHLNEAYPTSFFRNLGLILLIDRHRRFQNAL